MQLQHLEVCHAIMQVGSVAGAAQMLETSQSSLSQVLQHFELQLGLTLFEREARKRNPTPAARRLYQETGDLVIHLQGMRRVAARFQPDRERPTSPTLRAALAIRLI